MLLVDTSAWIDHLHRPDALLGGWVSEGHVATHPMVIGELACGRIKGRERFIALLGQLEPLPVVALHEDAMRLLEAHQLMGRGLGWIDIHLLASCVLSGSQLLTRDRRLRVVAGELGVGA